MKYLLYSFVSCICLMFLVGCGHNGFVYQNADVWNIGYNQNTQQIGIQRFNGELLSGGSRENTTISAELSKEADEKNGYRSGRINNIKYSTGIQINGYTVDLAKADENEMIHFFDFINIIAQYDRQNHFPDFRRMSGCGFAPAPARDRKYLCPASAEMIPAHFVSSAQRQGRTLFCLKYPPGFCHSPAERSRNTSSVAALFSARVRQTPRIPHRGLCGDTNDPAPCCAVRPASNRAGIAGIEVETPRPQSGRSTAPVSVRVSLQG